MATISCSCGATTTTRGNPLRGLSLEDRVELVRTAFAVDDGIATLELDGSWHPGGEPDVACVVLADVDLVDACVGLRADERRSLSTLLGLSHVSGRLLPAPVEVGPVRFRVTPAEEFTGAVTYLVYDGPRTLLEITEQLDDRRTLGLLVALYQDHGPAAVVQVDGLAPRLGLAAAIAGVTRARTPHVA
ncbi:hypothetical protein [Cellulomonas composti]|uniref:Uncharacterized protein n=1 Tax=Cellulomonas composti TaxID=266130 RepID=A0A511JDR4_9CELL|nr:hypothetical protein [Cellulomonas composti]GEL96086.1 hypothetical protein CCO02nite_27440 [Cellulomonas composti]